MSAAAAAALTLRTRLAAAQGAVMKKRIPSTGEQIPIIGLGSSATFSSMAQAGDVEGIRAVLEAMFEAGGTVFDTAPSYRASEEVAGQALREAGLLDDIFWATKVNVVRGFGGGGTADPAAARQQIEDSFTQFGRPIIDLIQVHNLADIPTQLSILKELKEAGRIRYIGTTTTFPNQYEQMAEVMRSEPLDFVGLDYAVDNTVVENELFRIAEDRGIAVMVYMPFGRTRLWDRVEGHEVPEWAAEFGAESWAQFFLKFAASHAAVTVVTPATSRPHHMVDNMGAALGRLPDEAERRRMIAHIEALPGG